MTPIERSKKISQHNSSDRNRPVNSNTNTNDGVVVVEESVSVTANENSFSILPSPLPHCTNMTAQYQSNQNTSSVIYGEVRTSDVVFGVKNSEGGLYIKTLREWWEPYAKSPHSKKRDICREVVKVMINRGVRFLNRIEDGTGAGYYTIEPDGSYKIERKVLRALRQEVLNVTDRLSGNTAPTIIKPVKDAGPPKKPSTHQVKKTTSKTKSKVMPKSKKQPSPPVKLKVKKGRKFKACDKSGRTAESKYIPILPAPTNRIENIKIVAPSPQIFVPPFPSMKVNTSLGSIISENRECLDVPMIPSAINFGTSDLIDVANKTITVPARFSKADGLPISASPDTVLQSEVYAHREYKNKAHNVSGAVAVHEVPLKSNISYDFSRIFDDTDYAHDDHRVSLPFLSERQSSMFSAVNFTEWSSQPYNIGNHEGSRVNSSLHQALSSAHQTSNNFHNKALPTKYSWSGSSNNTSNNDKVDVANVSTIERFDRNTIFDEGMAMVPLSPTPMRYTTTDESDHTLERGNKMKNVPFITPQHAQTEDSKFKFRIASVFDEGRMSEYQELFSNLDESVANLEKDNVQHKKWEAHGEALWRHFIQEQPELARILMSRAARDPQGVGGDISTSFDSNHVTPTPALAPRTSTTESSADDNVRMTSPVPWWFYESSSNPTNKGVDSHHSNQSVSMKWQQLFSIDMEENWEEV